MVAVSLDWKMVNVRVCIPISTPTLSGISQFFSGKKVTAPPKYEDARTPMNIFTLHSVAQADQAKKLLREKDTYGYVQINIADITK